MTVAHNSDIHMNMNGVNSDSDIKLYIKMVYEYLVSKNIDHYILNGDISWEPHQINLYRNEMVNTLGSDMGFHYTNGNHDISNGNGYLVKDYVSLNTKDPLHLKNSPIVLGEKVIIGMDTLYDYSYFNIDMLDVNRMKPSDLDKMYALSNERILDDHFISWEDVKQISDSCIASAESLIKQYKDKEVVFMTHYMPKKEFVSGNTQQDMHLALKNAFMGTSSIGEMLERNNVSTCYFGHTHRRFTGMINNVEYYCHPVGTQEDWEKFSTKHKVRDFTVYTKLDSSDVVQLLDTYNPSESVLNLFLQTVETMQFID